MTTKGVSKFSVKKNSGASMEPWFFYAQRHDYFISFAALYQTDEIHAITFWLLNIDDIKTGERYDLKNPGSVSDSSVLYTESSSDSGRPINSGKIKMEHYDLAGQLIKASFDFLATSTTGVENLISGYVSIDGFANSVPLDIQEKFKNRR